jgi:hypothetical protein
MHTITKQENVLLARWERKRPEEPFYRDGVAFPGEYAKSSLKTLFILREANLRKEQQKRYDLRKTLQTLSKPDWWVPKLSSWCHGLSNYQNDTRKTWSDHAYPVNTYRPFL